MGGWVDGHFDIYLKPPQPFTGLFFILLLDIFLLIINLICIFSALMIFSAVIELVVGSIDICFQQSFIFIFS